MKKFVLIERIIFASSVIYFIYATLVIGCRLTVWMGTEAPIWPFGG